jgi:membrane associated rhomboid family serine protease
MPLGDRDYMRPSSSSSGGRGRFSQFNLGMNPVMAIIVANVVIYLAALISGKGVQFAANLGLMPSAFTQHPWTIITSMFVHIEFGHIFGNMITLFFFGELLNKIVGNARFLLVYFIGGIAGSIMYLWLGSDYSVVIGASGAVYAIAGALVMLMPKLTVRLYFLIPIPLWIFVLVFFVLWSFIPGVAWQAHMGGLAVGLVAGYFFRKKIRVDFYR